MKRRLYEHRHHLVTMPEMEIWTDASGYAGGSVHTVCDETGQDVTYSSTYHWTEEASDMPINYKVSYINGLYVSRSSQELIMVKLTLDRYGPDFANRRITLMCDNTCTVAIWEKRKSKQLKYNRVVVDILELLRMYNIHLGLTWVPTDVQV